MKTIMGFTIPQDTTSALIESTKLVRELQVENAWLRQQWEVSSKLHRDKNNQIEKLRAELKERENELDKAKESVGVYYDAWQKELKHETMATAQHPTTTLDC